MIQRKSIMNLVSLVVVVASLFRASQGYQIVPPKASATGVGVGRRTRTTSTSTTTQLSVWTLPNSNDMFSSLTGATTWYTEHKNPTARKTVYDDSFGDDTFLSFGNDWLIDDDDDFFIDSNDRSLSPSEQGASNNGSGGGSTRVGSPLRPRTFLGRAAKWANRIRPRRRRSTPSSSP